MLDVQEESGQVKTKARILDAAEALFAERGPDGTSLRAITTAAQVNLAAVNYHFHSKDALFLAVYVRRLRPLNDERLRRLDALEQVAKQKPVAIEKILEALIVPLLQMAKDPDPGNQHFLRLLGRMLIEPGDIMQHLIDKEFKPLIERFSHAAAKALPHLKKDELAARMHFVIGAMLHCAYHQYQVEFGGKKMCRDIDLDRNAERLIAFATAGLKAH